MLTNQIKILNLSNIFFFLCILLKSFKIKLLYKIIFYKYIKCSNIRLQKCSIFWFFLCVQISENKINYYTKKVPLLVGEQIRKYRKMRKLTQTELANLVWKDRQYLYKIEKGKVNPSIFTLALIALALEISLSELLKDVVLEHDQNYL
ncbi:helix-turn-helix domain-containing protein [Flavobacterium solisilvae]|uniref:Helix-turn-helix transcriptional regulator n=1 Tax=Flavobacterium solisilvae TaxID=1852019 RepID=A0ABX1QRX2_9FLAO|nr:helix-turn-helix transcriptional regulator [Flavobacterium solisilvae]NMH24967.1 helix-turn-helix transcriptional regulator [Flavobacterium solisilvae]